MSQSVVSGDFAKRVVERLNDVAKDRGQRFAQQWGNPLDGQKPTRDEQARLWNMQNPQADPKITQSLLDSGKHAQAIDYVFPWRTTLIGTGDLKARIARAQSLADMAAQQQGGEQA